MPLKLRRSKTATFSVHKFADSHDYSQITSTQKRDRTFYEFKFTDFNLLTISEAGSEQARIGKSTQN